MFQRSFLVAFIAILLSSPALASDLSYTYVTVGAANNDIEGNRYTGYRISASVAISPDLFIAASTSSLDDNVDLDGSGAREVSADMTSIGMGYHTAIAENADFVGSFAFVNDDGPVNGEVVDGDGFEIGVGVRMKASEVFELEAGLIHQRVEDITSTSVVVGSRFYVRPVISLGVNYRKNEDDRDAASLDIRLDF